MLRIISVIFVFLFFIQPVQADTSDVPGPPKIQNISIKDIGTNFADFYWELNENGTSKLEVCEKPVHCNYFIREANDEFLKAKIKQVTTGAIKPDTKYYYWIHATDLSQNTSVTGIKAFKTAPGLIRDALLSGTTKPVKLIRADGDSKVYYINSKLQKKWLPTPEIFLSYGNRWEDIVIVDAEELGNYPTVFLVKETSDPKVYWIQEGNIRKWIPDVDTFYKYGFKFDQVTEINSTEMSFYRLVP